MCSFGICRVFESHVCMSFVCVNDRWKTYLRAHSAYVDTLQHVLQHWMYMYAHCNTYCNTRIGICRVLCERLYNIKKNLHICHLTHRTRLCRSRGLTACHSHCNTYCNTLQHVLQHVLQRTEYAVLAAGLHIIRTERHILQHNL